MGVMDSIYSMSLICRIQREAIKRVRMTSMDAKSTAGNGYQNGGLAVG